MNDDRRAVSAGEFRVEDLHSIDADGDVWLGHVELFGATYHVELVRVFDRGGVQDVREDAGELAGEKYEGMQAYYDGVYQLAKVPGLDGEYAMFVVPYCD